ncbi:hypothetical protein [Agromyces humi]|uniref:hypothetical protein n=1 Tax=Agromyces humi TaxID=1766800 RepID=UPI0013598A81|nr:hypothetical protein [Agromyces humi]
MNTLTDTDTGLALITTETGSKYLIDLDARTVRRNPSSLIDGLAGDKKDLPLLAITNCTIGEPLQLSIGPADRAITRRTTRVVSIVPAP